MELYDLRIEYDRHPVGLAERNPRFSWKLKSDKSSTMQKSYHIVVTNADDGSTSWDSGIIESDASIHVEYAGKALLDETEYIVHIEACDNHDEKGETEGSSARGTRYSRTVQFISLVRCGSHYSLGCISDLW